jgi:hypothetical protein
MNGDLSATEQRIVKTLRRTGPLTAAAIAEETAIPPRTVSDAVNRLITRKVLARSSPRAPLRLVEASPPGAQRRRKPKAHTSQRGSYWSAFRQRARTDPEGTINEVTVMSYLGLGVLAILAHLFGKDLVGRVATKVAHSLRADPPKPGMWPAVPAASNNNGHSTASTAPAASPGLQVVKPPAHQDPKHVCDWPKAKPGLQVGHAWWCNQDVGTGCGRVWTWTGDGWTPGMSPAAHEARRRLNATWVGMSRDVYVQASRTGTTLRSPVAIQNELQRRIAEYAARRPEPGALRTLRAMALKNPARADELLKRAGY